MKALGLISGTSADGLDAALIEIRGGRPDLLAARTFPYPAPLRRRVLAAPRASAAELAALHADLGDFFARSAKQFLRGKPRPAVVGSHGQTVFHIPGRASLQLGDAARIAAALGIPVVSDFRAADIAAGGSGAPLAPILDEILFGDLSGGTVALNLGGIANVTYVRDGRVRAGFDVGPANAPLDAVCRLAGGRPFDRDGRRARKGRVDERLLARLLAAPYFRKKPPKSLEREDFGEAFVRPLLRGRSAADLLATLVELCAASVERAVRRWCTPSARIVVSGGGARNAFLLERIANRTGLPVETPGLDPDAKEAVLFALLGAFRLKKRPGNVPAATGAKRRAVLGAVYLP